MNDSVLSNRFYFYEFHFHRYQHNDVSLGAQVHYVAWMKKGRVELVAPNETLAVQEGEVFYIPKGYRYHSHWYGDREGEICFDSLGFSYFPNPKELRYKPQVLACGPEDMEMLRQISRDKDTDCAGIGAFYSFFGRMLPRMQIDSHHQYDELMERALDYMYTHQEYKVADIAFHCGVSESGLYAIFKKAAGVTPVEMRHRIQVERAVELLTTTDLPIEEISDRMQFSSTSYFRKIIREQTGQTPREIRKKRSF